MMRSVFLGIDTATPYLSLALWSQQDGLLASTCERVERDHAKQILPQLGSLLSEAGVAKSQLEGVTVGIGPGSYTGLRVGIATAKGLARALGIPLRAESSLAAIAYGVLKQQESGLVALDARRGNVYAAVYQKQDARLKTLLAPEKCVLTEVQASYPQLKLFLDCAPDAGYLAHCALEGENRVEPAYL